VRRFELAVPGSVDECLQILAKRGPDTKVVAGGTDLLPQLKNGVLKPGWVVDLSAVAELRTISDAPDGRLRIGASVTARELELDARVRSRFAALAESAAMVGSVQVRNLATLGGNLCNAAPSADMAPPLLALDAEAVIAGPSGQRRVSMTVVTRATMMDKAKLLAPGDIVGITSGRAGLDYYHTGLVAFGKNGELLLRNASQRRGRVVEEPMATFAAMNPVRTVTLLRAAETAPVAERR